MDATSVESIALITNSNTNKNLSCGSSSSSSGSSGYASATTTPTNPSSVGSSNHSQYSDSHSTTPVRMVEPTPTSVPTVATISPYYNETYQQQQPQRQPQHAHTSHQQYQQHQTHSYPLADQMQSPTLSQYSNSASSTSYDSPNPYLASSSESYASQPAEVERNLLGMRHTTAFYTATAEKPNRLPQAAALGAPLSHIGNTYNTNNNSNTKIYNSSSNSEISLSLTQQKRSSGDSSTHASKPQAAATPFYAQPPNTNAANAYLDNYKNNSTKLSGHKLSSYSIDYTNYGSNSAVLDASTYAQNFPPYHGSKMLQDIAYSTGQAKQLTPLTNVRMSQQRLGGGLHYSTNTSMPIGVTIGNAAGGSGGACANSGAYMDKYVYTAGSAAPSSTCYTVTQPGANLSGMPYNNVAFAVASPTPSINPPQYATEITSDTYRKPSAVASSWHWSVEYPNGNCLPPPPQAGAAAAHTGLPTAAIPPSNASFAPSSNLTAPNSRDIYYTTDKYNNKYGKYHTYYSPHQHYTTGRTVWANAPHGATHLVPADLTERLPHHPYAHYAAPLPPGGGGTYQHTHSARQNCCSQTFQPQNCYYPRTAHYPAPAAFFANSYNPHTAQPIKYAVTGSAAPIGRSSSNNCASKYSMLNCGFTGKTKVNSNDIYSGAAATSNTPPTSDAASLNYHSYPSSVQPTTLTPHNQQQYSTPVETALSANTELSAPYYNDLNMQPKYENYLSPLQAPALIPQRRESLVQRVEHLPNIAIPYTKQPQPSTLTGSMVDYNPKHTTGATINDDCFMGNGGVTLTNLDEHMASNIHSNYESSSGFGELQLSNELVSAGAKSKTLIMPPTKTYSSLRDFLSTWNEDEDDYGCAPELKFVENETQSLVVEQEVLRSVEIISHEEVVANRSAVEAPPAAEAPHAVESIQPTPVVYAGQYATQTYHRQPQCLASVDENKPKVPAKKHVENTAIINLPDIIIDIEKSNGAAAAPTLSDAPKTAPADVSEKYEAKSTLYNIFDVEKELDELVTKKIKLTKTTSDAPHIRSTGSVIKEVQGANDVCNVPIKSKLEQAALVDNAADEMENLKEFGAFEYVDTTTTCAQPLVIVKSVEGREREREQQSLSTAVKTKLDCACDRSIESENTTSSNSSTFEKEYETFINKIGNVLDAKVAKGVESVIETPDISSDVPQNIENPEMTKNETKLFTKHNSDSDLEIAHKIKSYSKFYKRKRTYSGTNRDNECKKFIVEQKTTGTNMKANSNFPLTYTKICRKRDGRDSIKLKIRLKALRARLTKFNSYYQRRMRALRRYDTLKWKRIYTKALLKQFIAKKSLQNSLALSESKKKLSKMEEKRSELSFDPQSLKCLCVSIINSDMFRKKLLKAEDLERDVFKKNDSMEHSEGIVEPKEDLVAKASMPNTQHEISENSFSIKRTLETADKREVSPDKKPDTTQTDCGKVCKKLELDAEKDGAADVKCKKERITDIKNDFEENADVAMTDNFEKEEENEKARLNSSEAEDKNENTNTPSSPQYPELERSTPRVMEDDISNATVRNDKERNNSEHVVTVNLSNAKDYGDTLVVQEALENVEKTHSDRKTNESTEKEETVKTFKVIEDLHNQKQDEEELTHASSETLKFVEDNIQQVLMKHEVPQGTIDSPVADNAFSNFEDAQYDTMDLTSPAKFEPSPVNNHEESIGGFSEHELETISMHLRGYSNQSNSESKLLGFTSGTEDEEIKESDAQKDNNNENAQETQEEEARTPAAMESERKSNDRDQDFSETDNSVDMFGARKYVEYFTTESKNYFQLSSHHDENSTDSGSSSSGSSLYSSTSTEHKSASSSSSPNSSSDEDTQSSTTTEHSVFNELKELKKELSQNQIYEMNSLWMETEEEQKAEAAANQDKIRNENDVKTLKKILQYDSDEHEDMEITDDNEKQDVKINAGKDMRSEEHKRINEVIGTAGDNKERNEDSKKEVIRRGDMVSVDFVDEVLEEAVVENGDGKSKNKMKLVCGPDTVEEDQSPIQATKNSDDERENSIIRTEDVLEHSKIPKLSDLCKNALSSSFELSSSVTTTNMPNQNNAPEYLERELSVEEALAEMYRQVGVTSDVDDCDDDEDDAADDANVAKEAQDVVFINLEEILVDDSDLYVLQCDMNENVLNVVANNSPNMIINENVDDIETDASRVVKAADEEEALRLEREIEMRNNAITSTTNYLGPFMGAVDEDIHVIEEQLQSGAETSYTYTNSLQETQEFVENHSLQSQFDDFPAIHHEEIVSQDSKRYNRQLLYNSLREKYVFKRMNFRIQHGNRVIKKYINRWILQCLIARFRERELRKVQQLYLIEQIDGERGAYKERKH